MKNKIFLWAILAVAFAWRLSLISYGLPDQERLDLFFSGRPIADLPADELNVYRVLNTAYNDEGDILGAISQFRLKPLHLDPEVRFWGHLQFYVVTGALGVAHLTGLAELHSGKAYYFEHPEAMAALFKVGRTVTVLMATASVAIFYGIGNLLGGPAVGLLAAAILAVMPGHLYLSHFISFDVCMVFWASLALFQALRVAKRKTAKNGIPPGMILCAVLCGLAVGTKHHGALVIPAVLLLLQLRSARAYGLFAFAAFVAFAIPNIHDLIALRDIAGGFGNTVYHRDLVERTGSAFFFGYVRNLFVREPLKAFFTLGCFGALSLPPVAAWALKPSRRRWTLPFLSILALNVLADSLLYGRAIRYTLPGFVFCAPLIALCLGKAKMPQWSRAGLAVLILGSAIWVDAQVFVLAHQKNTEIATGRWIVEHIPAGSSIGLFHTKYDRPPIDGMRYTLLGRKESQRSFDDLGVQYVVLGDHPYYADLQPELRSFKRVATLGRNNPPFALGLFDREFSHEIGEFIWLQPRYAVYER